MSLSCSDSASAFFAAWSDALLVAASFSPGVLEGAGGTLGEVSLPAFFSSSSFFFFFSCQVFGVCLARKGDCLCVRRPCRIARAFWQIGKGKRIAAGHRQDRQL